MSPNVCGVCVCVCVHLQSFSSEWDTNEIHISKENSNRLNTPHPLADACRTSSVQTLVLSDPILHKHETSSCTITLVPSENRTQLWLKGMNKFFSRQLAYNNCASVRVRVCLNSQPVRLRHLYLPIQDIRLTVLCQTLLARLSAEESMT